LEEPLVAALTCFLKQEDPKAAAEEAIRHLDRYGDATKEWFRRVLPIMARLTRTGLDQLPQEEIALMQDQIETLLLTLRARSTLAIEKMCFCADIDADGKHKPLPEAHAFLPACGDRPGEQVLLYVELRNVGSIRKGTCYETRLSGVVKIHPEGADAGSAPAYSRNLKAQNRPLRTPTLCNDYFHSYCFYLPSMPAGKYVLTLEVTDETTQPPRTAVKKLPFVVAGEAVARE
jgi:hypothetical protein